MLASLFLLLLFTISLEAKDNPFSIKKPDTLKEAVVSQVEYIVVRKDNLPDTARLLRPYVLLPEKDTTTKSKDSVKNRSVFLPSALSYLPESKTDTIHYRTLFYPHALQVKSFQQIDKRKSINDWAFIILITGFLLFAGVQFSYHKRMLQIFRAFLAPRFLSQLMRGSDFYKERITYNLYLIFLFVFPLFLFEVNQYFQIYPLPRRPFTEVLFYLELFFLNLLVYSIKVLSLRIAGNIFKTQEITGEYLMTHFIFSLIQGIVVLIFCAVVVFTHSLITLEAGILILLLMYFFQLLRGFFIGLRNAGYSVLYLLLFFFTIEILPVLIVVKLLSNTLAT